MKITIRLNNPAPPSALPQLWRHKDDIELSGTVGRPDLPAVFPLRETPVILTDAWQAFLVVINPGMTLQHVAALLDTARAFANGHGFPGHRNYIMQEELALEAPRFEKCRTCARSVFTGVVEGDTLIPDLLDGNNPPPDYRTTNPRLTPWLFFTANNITSRGTLFPFSSNGGVYDWTPEPTRPFSFLPHVVRYEVGVNPVRIPLSNLVRLPPGSPVPSPYITR